MKITIIADDLSSNCLTRVYCLYSILRKYYDIQVMGICTGDGPYPVFDDNFRLEQFSGSYFPRFFKTIKEMIHNIRGDVIIPDNYNLSSFGVAMIKKMISNTPVLLGLSDYQRGLFSNWKKQSKKELILDHSSLLYTTLMEKMIPRADDILVSSRFLQNKFGGYFLPHGRNTDYLDPDNFNGAALRKKYRLEEKKVIMYFGKPTRYTDFGDLIESLKIVGRKDIQLVIVGGDPARQIERELIERGDGWVKIIAGLRPWKEIPEFLSMADLVVLPLIRSSFTQAYTPAKTYDAMAMGKPIISTRVSDMPEILEGCGVIVEPGDCTAIAENIKKILNSPRLGTEMGRKARHRCIEKYSWKAMETTLLEVMKKYEPSK